MSAFSPPVRVPFWSIVCLLFMLARRRPWLCTYKGQCPSREGRPCRRPVDEALQRALNLLALYLSPRAGSNCFLCGMAPAQNSTVWTIPTRNLQTTAHRINTLNFPHHRILLPATPSVHTFNVLTKMNENTLLSHLHKWQGALSGLFTT